MISPSDARIMIQEKDAHDFCRLERLVDGEILKQYPERVVVKVPRVRRAVVDKILKKYTEAGWVINYDTRVKVLEILSNG
jgi:hypothetical protein